MATQQQLSLMVIKTLTVININTPVRLSLKPTVEVARMCAQLYGMS